MTKKHFILLADMIKDHNKSSMNEPFRHDHLVMLASFCAKQNPNFDRDRWFDYINGKCGPSSGKI